MIGIVINILILGISIIVHEIAHGFVAYRFGDPTAKSLGRLSFNPIVHVDPIGTILLPALLVATSSPILFGWAKPVPINTRYFKNPERDMMFVALAGPLSNLTLASLGALLYKSSFILNFSSPFLSKFILAAIVINILLAVFNLYPIPPLDGSRILHFFLPDKAREWNLKIEKYGFAIIFLLAYLGLFRDTLPYLVSPILTLLLK